MRPFRNGPAWRVNLASDPRREAPAPVQTSALELPGEQKFALVFLRKAGPLSIAAKICKRLDEQSVPFPTGEHWRELRREGYITFERTSHRLTPKGNAAASDIMRDLCVKFSIHEFTRSGGKGSGLKSRCSCGWTSTYFRDSRGGESQQRSAETFHIRMVGEGKWPPRPVEEFIAEIMARKETGSGTTPLLDLVPDIRAAADHDAAGSERMSIPAASEGDRDAHIN